MPEVSMQDAFRLAVHHHQAGRYKEAADLYGQILKAQPNQADALHLLGVVLHQIGDDNSALQLISQAIAENPRVADYYCNLGSVFSAKGLTDDAINAYRQALAIKPNYAEAYFNLGNALMLKDQTADAIDAFRWSMALRPGHADTYFNVGRALQLTGEFDESIDAFRQTLAQRPDDAMAHHYLGASLLSTGKLDEAADEFRYACDLRPEMAEAWGNLGTVFQKRRKLDEAIIYLRKAMQLRPDDAQWALKLGEALHAKGSLEEATINLRQALSINPLAVGAMIALGNVLCDKGDIAGGIEQFRSALALDPQNQAAYSNMLFSVHAHPDYDAMAILNEHRKWAGTFATPLKSQIQPHANDRSPARKLRVGYVSPDLYDHPVGRNLLSLLKNHDRETFEIYCYSSVDRPDAVTKQIRENIHAWRDALALNDEKLVELIRKDRIDLLVDLSMHTGGNRLLAFARKPAPVQLSYLGFCTTTGLDTIDYRMSDPYIDPPGSDESCYSEQTFRLPNTFWCYNPDAEYPVAPLPALASGSVTFASMNAFNKVTPQAMDLWAQILLATPKSTLLIHSKEGSHLPAVRKRFEDAGVDPLRVQFVKRYARQQYYQIFHHIDICLDTFPYSGGITTCDSLWMGVPVVGFWGRTAAGRAAGSILSNIGLPDLVASTPDQYISIATKLASDLNYLSNLRATLRPKMLASPVLDAPAFAKNIESAYRQMWKTWCKSPVPSVPK